MIYVAAYCRVSTSHEDQQNSFIAQQRFFQGFIERNPDWVLYKIYADEGISGTSTKNRTAFGNMIQDAYAGKFQLILTKEVSRFSRNILDAIAYSRELRAIGISILFLNDGICTSDADAETKLSIMAAFAQEESRKTSVRVIWGQTRQMENGVVFGHSLLGYTVKNGKLSIDCNSSQTVKMIFHMYSIEKKSTVEIARFLEANGYLTVSGKHKWNPETITRILQNEKYIGNLVQKKTYTTDYLSHRKQTNHGEIPMIRIDGHHEPLISQNLWNLAQSRLQERRYRKSTTGTGNRYIFSGKIKCAVCGSGFVCRNKYLKNGTKVRRWSCATAAKSGIDACDIGRLVRDDDAMQMVKAAIRHLPLDTESIIRKTAILAYQAIRAGEGNNQSSDEKLQNEITQLSVKTETLLDTYFSGDISKEEMQSLRKNYAERQAVLQKRLEECRKNYCSADTKSMLNRTIASIISGETESEVFLKTLIDRLTVYKDRHLELRLLHLPYIFHFR